MANPKQLQRFRPWKGVVTDIPASEIPDDYYSMAFNVRFPDGVAERSRGYTIALQAAGPPPTPPLRISWPGGAWWVYVSDATQYAVSIGTYADISNAGLIQQSQIAAHSLTTLNGVAIHNNAKQDPMYWGGDPSIKFAPLPGWPTGAVCAFVGAHRYHLFACNFQDNPRLVRWSDAAEPGTIPDTWEPAADNEAGSVELSETPGEVICGLTLRDSFLIYKRDAIYAAEYVGGNTVFAVRPVFRNIGALSPRAVCATPQGHIVVTDQDVFITDGNSIVSIINNQVRNYLFDNLSSENYLDLFAVYNPIRRETVIGWPRQGYRYADRLVVWAHDTNAWTIGEGDNLSDATLGVITANFKDTWSQHPEPWADNTDLWSESVTEFEKFRFVGCRPVPPEIRLLDTTDPVTRTAYVERSDLTFNDPERFKYIRRIHVRRAPGSAALQVEVGVRPTLDDPVAWGMPLQLEPGQQFVNVRAMGRFVSIRIGATGTDLWTLSGFDVEYELRGYQ